MMSQTFSNTFGGQASPQMKDLLARKTRSPNKHNRGTSDIDDFDLSSNNYDVNSHYNDMFNSL